MYKIARTVFFTLIAAFLIFSLTKNFFSYRDKVAFYNTLQQEYKKEEDHNKQLKSDLKKGSDYFYVERQVREKLNLLREDELAVIIPPISPTPTPPPVIERQPIELWINLLIK